MKPLMVPLCPKGVLQFDVSPAALIEVKLGLQALFYSLTFPLLEDIEDIPLKQFTKFSWVNFKCKDKR
ncbi:unnamed protein product [Arctogadus glacialis]